MRILSWEEFAAGQAIEPSLAATVGVFDGLHVGHRKLISRVFTHGEGRTKAVLTFRENPKLILRPASYHGGLSSLEQKLEGLEALGLDLCVLIDFSGDFSKMAGRDFLSILREKGNLAYVAVGSNFSCGHGLDTHAEDIVAYYSGLGIGAEILDSVLWEGHAVSSSRIRLALTEGRLGDAAAMLGRPYEIDLRGLKPIGGRDGMVEFGRPHGIVLPPEGSYEAEAIGKGKSSPVRLEIGRESMAIPKRDLIGDVLPGLVSVKMLAMESKR
jgi:riboflavin kinase/FMN adenylyltransferase